MRIRGLVLGLVALAAVPAAAQAKPPALTVSELFAPRDGESGLAARRQGERPQPRRPQGQGRPPHAPAVARPQARQARRQAQGRRQGQAARRAQARYRQGPRDRPGRHAGRELQAARLRRQALPRRPHDQGDPRRWQRHGRRHGTPAHRPPDPATRASRPAPSAPSTPTTRRRRRTPSPPTRPTRARARRRRLTSLADASAFLYTGADPIQRGVAPGAIADAASRSCAAASSTATGAPVAGVRVDASLDHPEYGTTQHARRRRLRHGRQRRRP